jgi:hypothetical protein
MNAKTHRVRALATLKDVLAFCAGKEVLEEQPYFAAQTLQTKGEYLPNADHAALAKFMDGTGLLVVSENDQGYSELTPGEGARTWFYAVEPRRKDG